jgi:hypothetical protein
MIKKEILSFSRATPQSRHGFFVVSPHAGTPN